MLEKVTCSTLSCYLFVVWMQAIIWLERYLQTWPSTLLVVSHDRSFLDEVATDILHLHSHRVDTYRCRIIEA